MAQVPPVPMRSPVLEPRSGDSTKNPFFAVLHREIVRFLNELRDLIGFTSLQVGTVDIAGGSAAVPATDIPTSTLMGGQYNIAYTLDIAQAATTSSSVGLTLGWTKGGVSCSQAFALVTGNTTSSQTSDEINVTVDASTAIQYSVSYASAGATSMTYNLALQVSAWP